MLLVLGDRTFDVTHRAVVVGFVEADDPETRQRLVDEVPVALAVTSSSEQREMCERVDVPVGVVVPPDRVDFSGPATVASVGPFGGDAPERIAAVAAAVTAGARVVLSTTVRSDRRVAEVMARLLEARQPR